MENIEIIDSYINYLKYEKGYSPRTLSNYRAQAYSLKLNKHLSEYNSADIRKLLNDISSERSVKTRNYILSVIKEIYKYMINVLEYDIKNPTLSIAKTKIEQKERKSLSTDQIQLLYDCISENNIRDRTLFKVMVQTGMRISELINLKVEDVDLKGGFIFIRHGKGNKERYIPIANSLGSQLAEYMDYRSNITNEYLFYKKTHVNKYGPLRRETINAFLKDLSIKAGINPDMVSPHILRHTFATLNLCKGLDIYILSNVMGHSSINTTQIYAKTNRFRNKQFMENIDIFKD